MEFDKNLPVYWQIIEIVKLRIIRKEYLPGSMVPSVRTLAEECCVTGNTLQRAYLELVREGILVPVRGIGFKVTEDKRKLTKLREHAIVERLEKLHLDCIKMGISDLELCSIFDQYMNRDELTK